ncbi:hypothetical protein BDP55DRAFT_656653 [Colletotrichum godetiae]|uniref:Secreted protein n=1 Tax=Colletotrichum godetiae TaxID=1209918 RepID=A0AAJ0ATH8_9PEZI|nr:uncharacterized protein BDP55DRAFT_656653 [Colletotrichum godetiae]KAK1688651.1 hypothetical protein BDP55DRAFT_656653 [Colletotrichum godetiae]
MATLTSFASYHWASMRLSLIFFASPSLEGSLVCLAPTRLFHLQTPSIPSSVQGDRGWLPCLSLRTYTRSDPPSSPSEYLSSSNLPFYWLLSPGHSW